MNFDEKVNYIKNFIDENLDIIVHISGGEFKYVYFESRCFKEEFDMKKDKLNIYIVNTLPSEMKLVCKNFILNFKHPSGGVGMTRLKFNSLKQRVYYLKEYDEIIGTILYPSLKFKKDPNWKKSLPVGLAPFGLFYENYKPSEKEILLFLESRVIDIVKDRLSVEERNQMYDIYFKGKSISQILESKCIRLCELLDSMLGMNYKDSLWILPEDKLYMDYENYHINSNPRRYIPSDIAAKLEEAIREKEDI